MMNLRVCLQFFLFGVVGTLQWSSLPGNGEVLYACVGDELLLPWVYTLSSGDVVHDIQWTYKGHSEDMIALYTHGTFVPLPSYSHRVQQAANGGLRISHVTVGDSGNYTVEVTGADNSGVQFTERRSVMVVVADDLMTTDGRVHVTQSATAVPTGNLWAVELRCGQFTFQHDPPFDVEWITPSGHTASSSGYSNGHFSYFLTSPVTDGRYTCRVPSSTPITCTRVDVEASVTVDNTQARLTILEGDLLDTKSNLAFTQAQLTDTKSKLTDTLVELAATRDELNATRFQLTKRLDTDWVLLHDENAKLRQDLQAVNASCFNSIAHLEGNKRQSVSFHAHYLASFNERLIAGSDVVIRDVVTNLGNAYSYLTGVFTAPFSGAYLFSATTGPFHNDDRAGVALMANNVEVARVSVFDHNATDETATLTAVVHVLQHHQVWLKALYTANYWSDVSTFSGFLISQD